MNILVTGGAGYIGSVVVKELVNNGHNVVVVDDLSSSSQALVHPDAVFIKCGTTKHHETITPEGSIFRAPIEEIFPTILHCRFKTKKDIEFEGFDVVIHLAAKTSVLQGEKNPAQYFHENTAVTVALAQAASNAKVKKFIFASSAAIYGYDSRVANPQNVYGMTKHMSEQMLYKLSKLESNQTEFISLRLFNVCGVAPHFPSKLNGPGFMAIVAQKLSYGSKVPMRHFVVDYDPETPLYPHRDFIHVIDVAKAFVKTAEHPDRIVPHTNCCEYDICTGNSISTKNVLDIACNLIGKKPEDHMENVLADDAEMPSSASNYAYALSDRIGWHPLIQPDEMVASELAYWLETFSDDKKIPTRVQALIQNLEMIQRKPETPHQSPDLNFVEDTTSSRG